MSILIKGMEMPERCWDCDLCYDSFYCRAIEVQFSDREDFEPGERRLSDCPLVPVQPHGRLGDLDALYEKFARLESEAMSALKITNTGSTDWIKWSAILTERTGYKFDIADAPTIIPADPAEEGET